MKIFKYNESFPKGVKTIKTFDTRELFHIGLYDNENRRFLTEIQNDIKKIMKMNDDIIIFADGLSADEYSSDNMAWGIDEKGNLLDVDNDIIFNINSVFNYQYLKDVMERIIDEKEQTYLYQKFIIENDTRLIPTIKDKLNKKIEKEYPHLTSGKELNLL